MHGRLAQLPFDSHPPELQGAAGLSIGEVRKFNSAEVVLQLRAREMRSRRLGFQAARLVAPCAGDSASVRTSYLARVCGSCS